MRNRIFSGPMYGLELTAGLVRRSHPDFCGLGGDLCPSGLGCSLSGTGTVDGDGPKGLLSLSLWGAGRSRLVGVGGGPCVGAWN